ncbi:hypothetical protein SK128_000304, partial [Halocaridina rubra]
VDVSKAPDELQMEINVLSEENILKSLFGREEGPLEIEKRRQNILVFAKMVAD